ncbi:hypothetical protein [Xanthovirga aplysinae]|uniref:hypothetical protein n=1 Tax=Xanthovirga aplysinae TaxID=2529853 RepID=UPI0012BC1F58|nr:hypothetical protein [Xanthovirga aplysinae]
MSSHINGFNKIIKELNRENLGTDNLVAIKRYKEGRKLPGYYTALDNLGNKNCCE